MERVNPHIPTCIWLCTTELLTKAVEALGEPVDSYLNGSQVWLDDDGPLLPGREGDPITMEWRLHPVGGYARPEGVATREVLDAVLAQPGEIVADPNELWDGLECFVAYAEEVELVDLETLIAYATARIDTAPTQSGLVDHDVVAHAWETSERKSSIVFDLLSQMAPGKYLTEK